MAVVKSGGRNAITDYATERKVGSMAALVDCRLHTGRTHQIRVHMAHIGCAVVNDPLYGGRLRSKYTKDPQIQAALRAHSNQALHAYNLGFVHPVTGEALNFETGISNKINEIMKILDPV